MLLGVASLAVVALVRPVASAQPTAPTAASRPRAQPVHTGGAGMARPVTGAPDPVASYRIVARLDPEQHTIDGTAVVRWTNRSNRAQSELYWHLYLNGFRDAHSVFMRSEQARGFRGDGAPSSWGRIDVARLYARELDRDLWPAEPPHSPGDPEDRTDIRIALPEPIEPGQGLTLEIEWRSVLPALLLRTGHHDRFHMVAQWFPKLARLEPDGSWAHFAFHRLSEFYADFGSYDVTIDVPEGYRVGATGALVAESREGTRVRRRFVQQGVHDFAFTAWDGFHERQRRGPGGVLLRCLYPPGRDRTAALELDVAAAAMAHLNDAYGPYPYAQLTLVHPPPGAEEAGGMEYPTLITTGGRWYLPLLGARTVEQLVVHELAHQWFYGLVATDEHHWPFLDEGLTSYAEASALEQLYPGSSAFSALGLAGGLPGAVRGWATIGWDNDVVAQSAADFADGTDYGALVYAKAATLLATLSRVYGPERMAAALGRYAREQRFAHPTPDDLLDVVGDELGEVAAEQLRVGLFERSWVDYAVEAIDSVPAAAGASEGSAAPWRGQVLVKRRGNLAFPVQVELWAVDGSRYLTSWDGQGSHARIEVSASAPLRAAVVDPELRVLMDRRLSNNARTLDRPAMARFWAPRVLAHGAHAAQLALSFVAP